MMPHRLLSLLPFLVLFLSQFLAYAAHAQNIVAECGTKLLALAPCGPFAQDQASMPAPKCCENLDQLYRQKPPCLCMLLNDTGLVSSFPINTTLALQLPTICKLRIHRSTCSGPPTPALSPPPKVSFGARPKSGDAGSISASPIITTKPRTSFMEVGFPHSGEERSKAEGRRQKAEGRLLMLLMAATFTLFSIHPIY